SLTSVVAAGGSLLLSFLDRTSTSSIYTLSLHDALPILAGGPKPHIDIMELDDSLPSVGHTSRYAIGEIYAAIEAHRLSLLFVNRSEEHTSELQSRENLVCRLLLEKKKKRGRI